MRARMASARTGGDPPAETVESVSAAPEIIIGGKRYVNFGVNGYLGLGEHPKVRASIVEAAEVCGTGSAASRWTGARSQSTGN